ncbi:hypothetical protein N7481_012772 [Penicillium waksmanii]|uniref:uncharacterized protein n=1 Tax=Penicillium waksmanii TaxID=69791 RepID=UPI002549C0A8|nr:uncharacterized protein N7481_012772 [Penicillium waksmanii]KAJ5966058.1 hypothetical protein N7481_012772 [Penicillium waksmanii]
MNEPSNRIGANEQEKKAKEILLNSYPDLFNENQLYRGMPHNAHVYASFLFMEVIVESNHVNLFGPGKHTSTSFGTAMEHAWPGRAILIFKRPGCDSHDFQVWNPDDGEAMNWCKLGARKIFL